MWQRVSGSESQQDRRGHEGETVRSVQPLDHFDDIRTRVSRTCDRQRQSSSSFPANYRTPPLAIFARARGDHHDCKRVFEFSGKAKLTGDPVD